MSLDLIDDKLSLVNFGLGNHGNGLVLSGNKPLPEQMIPRPYVSHHMASPGLNELSLWLAAKQAPSHYLN